MTILGLEPIAAAVIFTAVGAGLQFGLGYLASDKVFDVKKALSTALISATLGIVTVSTALQAIGEEATDLEVLVVIGAVVATVAGIDGLKNSVIKAAKRPTKA
jgi:hypothetical protein